MASLNSSYGGRNDYVSSTGRRQFSLGLMYAEGIGVPQDLAQAAAWYRKAAGSVSV